MSYVNGIPSKVAFWRHGDPHPEQLERVRLSANLEVLPDVHGLEQGGIPALRLPRRAPLGYAQARRRHRQRAAQSGTGGNGHVKSIATQIS